MKNEPIKFRVKLQYDINGTSTVFELTNASKRRECYILSRRMLQRDPANSLELLLTFAETPADMERLTGGNSTRGCANMRVVGYIHRGEPGYAIIRRRPTVALRWDVMLTFQEKISSVRLKEETPHRCDASFRAARIQVLSTRGWVKSGLIVELT